MTYNQSSYIRVRFGIYHFVRRVPADLQQYYRSDRISMSLRTKSVKAAVRAAQSISQRLDDYWHGLILQKMAVPALHLLIDDKADVEDKNPNLLDAVDDGSPVRKMTIDAGEPDIASRMLGFLSAQKLDNLVKLAKPRLAVNLTDFDADPMQLCIENGVIESKIRS